MNEIRMYVERLFQGKTLTDDIIELKEEIYGNLVARYEDYLTEGMSEADALAKTQASMTSIDDMLAGEADATKDETMPTADTAAAATAEPGVTATEAAVVGAPTSPAATPVTASVDSAPVLFFNKKWIIAAAVIAVVIALGGIGFKIVDEMNDAREDQLEEQYERQQVQQHQGDAVSSDSISSQARDITFDEHGNVFFDGEPGDDLLVDVTDTKSSDIHPYLGTPLIDAGKIESALRVLPMSRWVDAVDVTKGSDVLAFSYEQLPDFDGDSIDAALVYNATALFCALPAVQEIRVTVSEADDSMESDYYVFQRATLESAYGTDLSESLVNESGWRQIKDSLYGVDFIDHAIDQAERDWR